ncbi:hypothetical protein [Nocardioides sp. LHG3406-4]|uniref:hypothetical protein n=1 Tax=Nocardioides sp. LHG3406-4 TaxID=2804575 RepID=UPI003CF92FFF
MDTQLGLLLILGPLALIVISGVGFRFLGPGRSSPAPIDAAGHEIGEVRLEVARSIAAGMVAPGAVPDEETLTQVLVLKDHGRPVHGVKLLRERTGLGLTVARRLVSRLP